MKILKLEDLMSSIFLFIEEGLNGVVAFTVID